MSEQNTGHILASKLIDLRGLNYYHDKLIEEIDEKYGGSIDSVKNLLVNITYSELKSKRDHGWLIPGAFYRITDYVTTTSQSNTQSAGHQFDLIVTADDEKTLNEKARAIQHEEDTYFTDSDLNAWQIWYCIDNDTNRFEWADAENGKGVIYRMIDGFNNDCPYDFKNIQFKHPKYITTYPDYYYTFSTIISDVVTDYSMIRGYCHNNTIKDYIGSKKQRLNNNIFLNTSKNSNCHSNSFGNNCHSNSFGDSCTGNSFGNNCYSNSFGDYCDSNSFGNSCSYNSFGNSCSYNSFGNSCGSNSFGDYCDYNSFGNRCNYNSFKVSLDNASSIKNYAQNNHFDDNCSYNVIWNSNTTNSGIKLQNININRGVSGTSSSYNFINITTLNQDYELQVAKNSKGEIKIYCEADLIA